MLRSLFITTTLLFMHVVSARRRLAVCEDVLGGNGLDDLPSCRGGTDDLWFNFDVKLDNVSEQCDEKDRFVIGALVSELVQEIECSIPEYKNERFDGELCETPNELLPSSASNRALRALVNESHRQLGTSYVYRGGGRCQRCRNSRRLRSLKEITVDAACSFAGSAEIAAELALSALDQATASYEEVVDLAGAFYDAKKGEEIKEKAEKELEKCAENEKVARSEAELAKAWCENAKRETSSKRLDECIKGAEKNSKNALDETKNTRKAFHKVNDMKFEIIQEGVRHENEELQDKLKVLIEKMKNDIEDRIDSLDNVVKDLKIKRTIPKTRERRITWSFKYRA